LPAADVPCASYDGDVVAWAEQQAALVLAGRWELLDRENIAEEILGVGRSEKRELVSRMAMLLMHLLKWQAQPERISASWRGTILEQRAALADLLEDAPSLRSLLGDEKFAARIWKQATAQAMAETGQTAWPSQCPWPINDVLTEDWLSPTL
jgi:hypothetical protein